MASEYLGYFFGGVIAFSIATVVAWAAHRPRLRPSPGIEDEIRGRLSAFWHGCLTDSLNNPDLRGRITGILYQWALPYNSLDRYIHIEDAEAPTEKVIEEIKRSSSDGILTSVSELHHRTFTEFMRKATSEREDRIDAFKRSRMLWLIFPSLSILVIVVAVAGCVLSDEALGLVFSIDNAPLIGEDAVLQLMIVLFVVSVVLFLISALLRPDDVGVIKNDEH